MAVRIDDDGSIVWEGTPSPKALGANLSSAGFDDEGNFGLVGMGTWKDPDTGAESIALWSQRTDGDGNEAATGLMLFELSDFLIDTVMHPKGDLLALLRHVSDEESLATLLAIDPSGASRWHMELHDIDGPSKFYWVGLTVSPATAWVFGYDVPDSSEPKRYWAQSMTRDGTADRLIELDVGTCQFEHLQMTDEGDFVALGERFRSDVSLPQRVPV